MRDVPNVRSVDGEGNVTYEKAGGALKVRYLLERDGSFLSFSPANLHVELNGHKIELLQKLVIEIDKDFMPTAQLTFKLDSLDIDMDSLMALKAIIEREDA